jgi:hypothetical protein
MLALNARLSIVCSTFFHLFSIKAISGAPPKTSQTKMRTILSKTPFALDGHYTKTKSLQLYLHEVHCQMKSDAYKLT